MNTDKSEAHNRLCYYVPPDGYDEKHGYRVAIVEENEPGYSWTGNIPEGGLQAPYYWGHNLVEAKKTCRRLNTDMGLSERDVLDIITSSMAASSRRGPWSKRR